MRLIKMFGLAVVAAVAAMALVGASSAMATSTALCTTHTAETCASPYTGSVTGLTTSAVLKGSLNVTCTHSEVKGTALGLAAPLVGHVSALTFTGCGGCEVTVVTTGLLLVLWTALNKASVKAEGFKVVIKCFGETCTYTGTPELSAEGGSTPLMIANEAILEEVPNESGFFCSEKGKWTATYTVSPAPLYILK